jgi:hypothetical protein
MEKIILDWIEFRKWFTNHYSRGTMHLIPQFDDFMQWLAKKYESITPDLVPQDKIK